MTVMDVLVRGLATVIAVATGALVVLVIVGWALPMLVETIWTP